MTSFVTCDKMSLQQQYGETQGNFEIVFRGN